jgi:hypothetical protein
VPYSQADLNAIANAQGILNANIGNSIPSTFALGIAQKETGSSANADTATSGTGPIGLFQIAPSTYIDPGYGLPKQSLTYAQAATALQDPDTNATFAAQYITALYQKDSGNLNQAVLDYSGGGYNSADVAAATPAAIASNPGWLTMAGASAGTSQGGSDWNSALMGTLSGQSSGLGMGGAPYNAAGGNVTNSGSWIGSLISWATEIFYRGGVIGIGVVLLIIGLVFMFVDAKSFTSFAIGKRG